MNYEVFGGNLPAVTIKLDANESIYTESGGMSWMTDGIVMKTDSKGGVLKGLGRMMSGESFFMNTYTASKSGEEITIASSFPGAIVVLDVTGGKEYICQKDAFLCAQPDVELSMDTKRGITGGLFGGEGFIMQRLKGNGLAFIEIDGSCKEMELAPGQKLKVDTGNVAAYEASVKYSVETVKGIKNKIFGGEGLFLTTLEGPGKVWLQTMTMPSFAQRIIPFIPKKS